MPVRRGKYLKVAAPAVSLAGLALAGCADFARVTSLTPAPLDRTSPVATQVRAASRAHYRKPSFRNVPPAPMNVRQPGAFKPLVAENVAARSRLDTWVAENPPMAPLDPQSTEAYAASQRARIPADEAKPLAEPAGSEEYAARLRELATPPPPPR